MCCASHAQARRSAARKCCSRSAISPSCATRVRAKRWRELGFATTLDYLEHIAGLVLRETGLLPHLNPGLMNAEDLSRLRRVAPSMGIMLESASERLCERGGPHFGSPDKLPCAPPGNAAARRRSTCADDERHSDRHRRNAARAPRRAARLARAVRSLRSHSGNHRPELPRQARHEDARRAGAFDRRAVLDDRRCTSDLRPAR